MRQQTWTAFKQNIPQSLGCNQRLLEHVQHIITTESDNTRIHYTVDQHPDECALTLVMSNNEENFQHIHYFFMDEVDQQNGEYLHVSFPASHYQRLLQQESFIQAAIASTLNATSQSISPADAL